MTERPLVSCLMVTRPAPERLPHLRRSLDDYRRQTHRPRELVAVIDARDPAVAPEETEACLRALGDEDVSIFVARGATSLGALRNASLARAKGDLFCVWDDDDRHHPERLERQVAALAGSGAEAICLQHVAHHFVAEQRLYVTNWLNTEVQGLPGTLLCRRDAAIAYSEVGERAEIGEDMAPLEQLLARGGLRPLADQAHLYVYVWHGWNSHAEAHHRRLVEDLGLSRGLLRRREAELRAGFAAFDLGRLTVEGRNGPAFTLS